MSDIDRDEIITLDDEDGNSINFVVIDGVEYNGKNYLALVEEEHYDDDECEFTILRVDEQSCDDGCECDDDCCCGGEYVFSTIEDEDEFNAVMELLEEKLDSEDSDFEVDDEYDLADDEDEEEDDE